VVVRDDDHPGVNVPAVDRDAEAARPPHEKSERLQPRERIAVLAPVDEPCVKPERDVVHEQSAVHACDVDGLLLPEERLQRGERIAAVELEVACEVIEGAERNDHERHAPIDRDVSHCGQ
jgi:hypothetical protein